MPEDGHPHATIRFVAGNDRRIITWSLVVAAVCALVFLFLALWVPTDGAVAFDLRVTPTVQGLPIPAAVWEILTMLGGVVLVTVDVAVVVVLLARREVAMAILFAATLIAVTLGVDAIKDTVARARPPDPLVTAQGGSFPSGHAFLSTVSYGLLALVAWRSSASRAARIAAIVGAALLVFLIGCSRIALGVHYPTDVVAGWLGGIAVVAVVLAITTRLDPLPRTRSAGTLSPVEQGH